MHIAPCEQIYKDEVLDIMQRIKISTVDDSCSSDFHVDEQKKKK